MTKLQLKKTTTVKKEDPATEVVERNAERDSLAEMSEVLQGFKDRSQREQQRYWESVDTEYWFAVCFQTREQKEEFLTKLDLFEHGDKYLDGLYVARKLGITISSPTPKMPRYKVAKDLIALARGVKNQS